MPLWKIFHSPGLLTSKEEKQAIAEAVTQHYVSVGLPDFYVNVHFYSMPSAIFYTAGKEVSEALGIEILHVARNWDPTNKARGIAFKDAVDKIMEPYSVARGIHLEYCVIEGPAALWRINGIDPPEAFEPGQHQQAEINKKKLEDYQKQRH